MVRTRRYQNNTTKESLEAILLANNLTPDLISQWIAAQPDYVERSQIHLVMHPQTGRQIRQSKLRRNWTACVGCRYYE